MSIESIVLSLIVISTNSGSGFPSFNVAPNMFKVETSIDEAEVSGKLQAVNVEISAKDTNAA